jgi:hypothetical protein
VLRSGRNTAYAKLVRLLNTPNDKSSKKEEGRRKKEEGRRKKRENFSFLIQDKQKCFCVVGCLSFPGFFLKEKPNYIFVVYSLSFLFGFTRCPCSMRVFGC